MKLPGLALAVAVALTSACADANGREAADGGAVPVSGEAGCPGGSVGYNADHVAGATGAATPADAVRAFLKQEGVTIRAAEVEQQPRGLRYLDADGRAVADLHAAQYDGSTWLLNRGTWCSDNFERDK